MVSMAALISENSLSTFDRDFLVCSLITLLNFCWIVDWKISMRFLSAIARAGVGLLLDFFDRRGVEQHIYYYTK